MISECSITMLVIGQFDMEGKALPKKFYLSSRLILDSTRLRSNSMTLSSVELSELAS